MAASRRSVFPWVNKAELCAVYEELYSNDPSKIKHALARIIVWKSRAQHKLSVAVESSADLAKSVMLHQEFVADGVAQSHDRVIRSIYSMAITRFINHITEKNQNQHYAKPIHRVADEFGIPHWLVRLRHDAGHNEKPSLDMLQHGVEWALQYLKIKFWKPQFERCEEAVNVPSPVGGLEAEFSPPRTVEHFQELLLQYQQIRFKDFGAGRHSKPSEETLAVLGEMGEAFLHDNKLGVMKVLCEDGFLISTKQQLSALGVNPDVLLTEWGDGLPTELVLFWQPLLHLVHTFPLATGMLLLQLASLPLPPSSLRTRLAAGWLYALLTACRQHDDEQPHVELFKNLDLVALPLDALWVLSLENPHHFTAHILPLLIPPGVDGSSRVTKATQAVDIFLCAGKRKLDQDAQDMEMSEGKKHRTDAQDVEKSEGEKKRTDAQDVEKSEENLPRTDAQDVDMYEGEKTRPDAQDVEKSEGEKPRVDAKIYTLEDVQQLLSTQRPERRKPQEPSHTAWRPATECVDWACAPLGQLPWQQGPPSPYSMDLALHLAQDPDSSSSSSEEEMDAGTHSPAADGGSSKAEHGQADNFPSDDVIDMVVNVVLETLSRKSADTPS